MTFFCRKISISSHNAKQRSKKHVMYYIKPINKQSHKLPVCWILWCFIVTSNNIMWGSRYGSYYKLTNQRQAYQILKCQKSSTHEWVILSTDQSETSLPNLISVKSWAHIESCCLIGQKCPHMQGRTMTFWSR